MAHSAERIAYQIDGIEHKGIGKREIRGQKKEHFGFRIADLVIIRGVSRGSKRVWKINTSHTGRDPVSSKSFLSPGFRISRLRRNSGMTTRDEKVGAGFTPAR